jgi:predicted TIM-barrel fold metal-dependent hydrolase
MPPSLITDWSPQRSLEQMDQAGVISAVVSITSPGVWWGDDDEGRKWARVCNEYGAGMVQNHPGRYGMFAVLPLPDIEGTLQEIDYALDKLLLDGCGLLSSYEGRLLGDDAFRPVFDELNRRKAVVFVHPTMLCCGNVFFPLTPATIEAPTDTTRTIASLLFSGTFARCPDVRFVFSHGGGTMPMVVQRVASNAARFLTPGEREIVTPHGVESELRRQHYDLAGVALSAGAMAAVLKLVPVSQLCYGSDTPFGSAPHIASALANLGLSDTDLRAIQRENALRLFPRFG